MLLITKVNAKTKIEIDNHTVPFLSNKEKITILGSFAWPSDTATIPQKPKIRIIGKTIKNELTKPFFKSWLDFAAYTLCQIPWSNKFVANTAMKKVIPAV